jgi:glutaredoxin 3
MGIEGHDVRRSRAVGYRFAVECVADSPNVQPSGQAITANQKVLIEVKLKSWENMMNTKKKIEVFSAGCSTCNETIEMVKRLAGSSHEVVVHDMQKSEIATKAKNYGVRSVPAVVIDGKLASCCAGRGVEEHVLLAALR